MSKQNESTGSLGRQRSRGLWVVPLVTSMLIFGIPLGQAQPDPEDGQITIQKQTRPRDSPDSFQYSGAVNGNLSDGGELTETVPVGNHTVTETADAGWLLIAIACNDDDSWYDLANRTAHIVVAPGEHVTCVFYNQRAAEIIVRKIADPSDTEQTFDFEGDVAGTIGHNQTLSAFVPPGLYNATEIVPDGWNLTAVECDHRRSWGDAENATAYYHVRAGERHTCTFYNEEIPPPPPLATSTLIVVKQTDPPGSPQQFNFSGDAQGDIGDDESIIRTNLTAGTYNVTELVPHGWRLDRIECDDGNSTVDVPNATASYQLEDDETVTCTFYNTQQARLVLEKQARPASAPTEFNFTGDLSAQLSHGEIATWDVDPGNYSVTEEVPEGWRLVSIRCTKGATIDFDNATVTYHAGPGDTIRCRYYDLQLAKIIVHKITDPPGANQTFNFTGDLEGSIGHNESLMDWVLPGKYHVFEEVPPGWNLTAIQCDHEASEGNVSLARAGFHVRAGWVVTCTFYNGGDTPPLERGVLIVKKVANETDGRTWAFTGAVDTDLPHNGSYIEAVDAGTYNVSETPQAGWRLVAITCDDGDSTVNVPLGLATYRIADGETVTCTFYNEPEPDGDFCPKSQGYWKNHEEAWPVLSLQLGNETYTQQELLDLLNTPVKGDKSISLAYQLIAAKLNIAAGAPSGPADGPIADADAILAMYAGKLPYGIDKYDPNEDDIKDISKTLDYYNNGKLTKDCQERSPVCPEKPDFWEKNADSWPVLELMLGNETYSNAELLAILEGSTSGDEGLKLAVQLIAAKLNIARGSDSAPVDDVIADADALLALYAGKLPYGIDSDDPNKEHAKDLREILYKYNKGYLTKPCEEDKCLDDDDRIARSGDDCEDEDDDEDECKYEASSVQAARHDEDDEDCDD